VYPTSIQVVPWLVNLACFLSFVVRTPTLPKNLRLLCNVGFSPYNNSNGLFKLDFVEMILDI
jgi:hypothetical protein